MADFSAPNQQQDPDAIRKALLAKIFGAGQPQPATPSTPLSAQPTAPTMQLNASAGTPATSRTAPPTTLAKPLSSAVASGSGVEPGNQPPSLPNSVFAPGGAADPSQGGGKIAPSFLSETDWAKQQGPGAPHTPYVAPDLKHRMLMGLFTGLQQFGRDPGAGERMLNNYLGNIQQKEEAEKTYPQTSAAAAHQRYMDYSQNEGLAATIAERQAHARDLNAQATERANPPQKLQHVALTLPNGESAVGSFDPKTGKYLDSNTQQPLEGAKPGKPEPKDFDAFYPKYLKEHTLPDTATNEAAARKAWNQAGKETQEPGSFIPTYDPKTGTLTGAWDPKSGRTVGAPQGGGTTGTGLSAQDKREQEHQKQLAPYKAIVDEADKAQTLKDMADKGNGEADVDLALTFFKTMRSAASGSSGIRFTSQENDLIMGSRSLWDSLEVKGNKLFSNGQPLSKTQRQEILDVINVHKQAAQRQLEQFDQPGAPAGNQPAKAAASAGGDGKKVFSDADVQAAVQAHPGLTADQAEQSFKAKGWSKKP